MEIIKIFWYNINIKNNKKEETASMKIIIYIILILGLFYLLKKFQIFSKFEILEKYDNILLIVQVFFGEEEYQLLDFSLLQSGIVGIQFWTNREMAKEVNGRIQEFYGAKILRIKNKGEQFWIWQLPEE